MPARSLKLVRIAAFATIFVAALAAPPSFAAPTERPTPASRSLPVTAAAGPAAVTLHPGRLSVPIGSSFAFAADVESRKQLAFLQARLRLLRPDGSLVYQKTFVENSLEPTTVAFTWKRSIADIGLGPNAYPVDLGVDVERAGETSHAALPAMLYVYDPAAERLAVSLVARISAQPLSDPQGRFVSDPGRFTRARDDAHRVADWVLRSPEARVTLSLSPVMLREWLHIAAGYQLVGAEGNIDVPPTDPVPLEYAATLDSLRRAVATGRLEVLSCGYADPDLSELKGAGLLDDVTRHYAFGTDALIESLGATPSAGSAPTRGAPEDALTHLAGSGLNYIVVPETRVKQSRSQRSGPYRTTAASVTALVADSNASRAVTASTTAEALDVAFTRYLAPASSSVRSLPVLVTLGPGAADVAKLLAVGDALAQSPWARLVTGAEATATRPKPRVTLKGHKPDPDAPAQYWERVAESRSLADALHSALPAEDEAGPRAVRQSLVAAGSAWAGVDGEWAPATSGLAFATSAIDAANDVFQRLTLAASRITLAGSKGTLPITVTNDADRPLHVVLLAKPSGGVKLQGPARREVDLGPGDNFVEIPVVLENAISGEVAVQLMAGDTELAGETVRVQASYLDRLVIGGGALILLAGLLVLVIRRVRAAEGAEELDVIGPGQMTPQDAETPPAQSDSSQEEHEGNA